MNLIKNTDTIPSFADGTLIIMDDIPYRIISRIKIEAKEKTDWQIFLMDLSVYKFHIIMMYLSELLVKKQRGEICSCEDTDVYPTPVLERGDQEILDMRYFLIKKYLDNMYPDFVLLQRRDKGDVLQDLAASCNLSTRQTRRLVYEYLRSGGTKYSIADKRVLRSSRIDLDYNSKSGKVRGRKYRDSSASSSV